MDASSSCRGLGDSTTGINEVSTMPNGWAVLGSKAKIHSKCRVVKKHSTQQNRPSGSFPHTIKRTPGYRVSPPWRNTSLELEYGTVRTRFTNICFCDHAPGCSWIPPQHICTIWGIPCSWIKPNICAKHKMGCQDSQLVSASKIFWLRKDQCFSKLTMKYILSLLKRISQTSPMEQDFSLPTDMQFVTWMQTSEGQWKGHFPEHFTKHTGAKFRAWLCTR